MMFTLSVKNPLYAETIGERRERKAKQSDGSIRSSRSSLRSRLETKSVKSNKFKVAEAFRKASKTPTADPDDPPEIAVKQDVNVSPSELPASPVSSPPASQSAAPWPHAPGCSELSTSPSVSKRKPAKIQPFQPQHSSWSMPQETRPEMRSLQSFPFTNATGGIKPIEAADLVCPVEFDPNVAGQAAEHRQGRSNLERFLLIPSINFSDSNESLRQWVASYPSSWSTCSTSESDPFPTPRRIPGEMCRPNMRKSSMPAGFEQYEPADTPVTAVSTGPELDSLSSLSLHRQSKAESESACLPGSVAHRHAVRQGDPTWSAEIRPLEDDIPLRLRLMEIASNQIHYQRLSESWDGLSFDMAKLINFEKRLWALSGLKRLNHLLRKGESLRDGPGLVANDGDATKRRQDGENLLHICEDGAESWLQAATSHNSKIYCLLPSEAQGLTAQWNSRPNVYTNYWADIPTLPYQDSFMDLISSRSIPLLLRSSQWPVFVQECVRVLRPGGVIELTILDPMPRNCGPLLRQWTARNLVLGLERRSLVTHPAMIIPLWLDDVADFGRRESMTFTYSATVDEDTHELRPTSEEVVRAHPQSDEADRRSGRDLQRLGTTVGRHFYQTLYNDLVPEVFQRQPGNFELEQPRDSIRHWWWKHPAIVRECKEQGTVFEMVTYKCCKKEPT